MNQSQVEFVRKCFEEKDVALFESCIQVKPLDKDAQIELFRLRAFELIEIYIRRWQMRVEALKEIIKPEYKTLRDLYVLLHRRLPDNVQRELLKPENKEFFLAFIKSTPLSPMVEVDLLKPENKELFLAYIELYPFDYFNQWQLVNTQRLELFYAYVAKYMLEHHALVQLFNKQNWELFKEYVVSYPIKANWQEKLFLPENEELFYAYVDFNFLAPKLEARLLRPKYAPLLKYYLEKQKCFLEPLVQEIADILAKNELYKLLNPRKVEQFSLFLEVRSLEPEEELWLFEPGKDKLFELYVQRHGLCVSGQKKLFLPEYQKLALKYARLCPFEKELEVGLFSQKCKQLFEVYVEHHQLESDALAKLSDPKNRKYLDVYRKFGHSC